MSICLRYCKIAEKKIKKKGYDKKIIRIKKTRVEENNKKDKGSP